MIRTVNTRRQSSGPKEYPERWPTWTKVEIEAENERGGSLIEVLVAMMILFFVMVGVLQLFVTAVAVERVADAQGEMMVKARSVVEVIRLVSATGAGGNSGVLPLGVGRRSLPDSAVETGFDFWGPSGFAVIDHGARYSIEYEIQDEGADWLVTVYASPKSRDDGVTYLQSAGKKGVRYAARVPK